MMRCIINLVLQKIGQITSETTLRPTFVRPPIVTQKGRHSWVEIDLWLRYLLNHYNEIIDAVVCQVFCIFSLFFFCISPFHSSWWGSTVHSPPCCPPCSPPASPGRGETMVKRLELSSFHSLPYLKRYFLFYSITCFIWLVYDAMN